MGANGLKVQTAVSMLLQRALHDPSREVRVLSSEKFSHLKKKIIIIYILLLSQMLVLGYVHTWHLF